MGIFATVLFQVLYAHRDDDYSYLGGQGPKDDPVWYPLRRLAIAPEAINRLKSAAGSKTKRATLNPSDLEYFMERVNLTETERKQLRAALVAQGVEIFLYDRMSPADRAVISKITEFVYNELLIRHEIPLDQIREGKFRTALTSNQRKELALALTDRVGTLIQAGKEARKRKAREETSFWQSLIKTGYQEIASLLAPVAPTIASRFERLAQGKPDDLLDVSPERIELARDDSNQEGAS